MLQTTVLSFCVLSDGDKVDVVISGLVAWDAETWTHICVQLQLLTECQVERPVTFSNGSSHRTLQPDPVFL